jgi:hypothetical protein
MNNFSFIIDPMKIHQQNRICQRYHLQIQPSCSQMAFLFAGCNLIQIQNQNHLHLRFHLTFLFFIGKQLFYSF